MIEFVNKNLVTKEPSYYYLVEEMVTTFGMDEGKNEPIHHEQKFEGVDLLKCKADAEKYYWERLEGLEKSKYFLEFAAPRDFEFGKNAAYSIYLSFVEYHNEEENYLYRIFGCSDATEEAESIEFETFILREKGFI